MISGEFIALADALSHGDILGNRITIRCERCMSDRFYITDYTEEARSENEDIIIEKRYVMVCADCGAIEADMTVTLIPSWVYSLNYEHLRNRPLYDAGVRDKLRNDAYTRVLQNSAYNRSLRNVKDTTGV